MASLDKMLKNSMSQEGYRQFKKEAKRAVNTNVLKKSLDKSQAKALKRKIDEIDDMRVYVGIPSRTSSRPDQTINNAELLYIQTNGTSKKRARQEIEKQISKGFSGSYGSVRERVYQMFLLEHGSPAYSIPPRPVIEPAILDIKDKIGESLSLAFKNYIAGEDQKAKELLNRTGLMAQSSCQKWFENPKNNWPPLAPSTIAGKKKKHGENYVPVPLVDTGALRQSITYVIEYPNKGRITE